MEKKWNLQDIKPTDRRRASSRSSVTRVQEETPTSEPRREGTPRKTLSNNNKKKKTGLFVAGGVVALFIIVGFVFAIVTSGAQVTVFPKFREPTVNAVFEASRQGTSGELTYELLTLEAEGERQVTATGEEEVETLATGVITIYNTGDTSQRLITNTRFQTENGLVFRISDPAVVPAATSDGPGTVTAEVYADEAGSSHNIPSGTRLNVPGFRENDMMDLYNSVYAESLGDFTGGYAGPRFIIDEQQLAAATESLQGELRQALEGRVDNERPAGFTLFNSARVFVYRDLPPEEVGDGMVKIKQRAILQVPIFKNEDLASYVAAAVVPGYEGEAVSIRNTSVFTFEYTEEVNDLSARDGISFRLIGKPLIVWVFDAEQLKRDLAGGAQTSLNTVLGGYPAIERATATIRPFWQTSFPQNPEDITIVESLNTDN